jgi:hypothetical protein
MIPSDISNLIAEYDPQAYTTLSTSPVTKTFDLTYEIAAAGASRFCSAVPDQSGQGNNLTEISSGNGVGHAPKFSNFRHCFYNTASTKAMSSTIVNEYQKDYTWVFCFETPATLGTDALFGAQDATGRRMYISLRNDGTILFGAGDAFPSTSSAVLSTSTYYFLVVSWENSTGTLTAYLNGSALTLTSASYTIPTADCDNPLLFFARDNNGATTDFCNNIPIGTILGYEKILSETERLQLQRYYERQWRRDLIFVVIDSGGQSQEQGNTVNAQFPNDPEYGTGSGADEHDFRILQYGRGGDDGEIILGCQTFDHWDKSANDDVGPHLNACKAYLAYLDNPLYADRIRIVVQPGAKGGSGLVDSTGLRDYWVATDPIYDDFFTRSNAMKALLPHYQQALISWHQGYADASDGTSEAAYETALDALFAAFRGAGLNGTTASTPIELGTLGGFFDNDSVNSDTINGVINDTPNRLSNIGVTSLDDLGESYVTGDGLHLDPPGARIFGDRKGATWVTIAPSPLTSYGFITA